MRYIRKHLKLFTIILIIILTISYLLLKYYLNNESIVNLFEEKDSPDKTITENIIQNNDINITETPLIANKVKVDIKGEVKNPNVYELENNSRVIDVINLAGGLTENADTTLINLSKQITDEMVIIIYSKKEVEDMNKDNIVIKEVIKEVEKECNCPNITNDACITKDDISSQDETTQNAEGELINLNNCTIYELENINGLGQTKAQAIIDYQKEKGFNKIEDLLEVKGIGQTIYEKIKDYFTIE